MRNLKVFLERKVGANVYFSLAWIQGPGLVTCHRLAKEDRKSRNFLQHWQTECHGPASSSGGIFVDFLSPDKCLPMPQLKSFLVFKCLLVFPSAGYPLCLPSRMKERRCSWKYLTRTELEARAESRGKAKRTVRVLREDIWTGLLKLLSHKLCSKKKLFFFKKDFVSQNVGNRVKIAFNLLYDIPTLCKFSSLLKCLWPSLLTLQAIFFGFVNWCLGSDWKREGDWGTERNGKRYR